MKKTAVRLCVMVLFLSCMMGITGCSDTGKISPDNPVTLTIWHVYGGQTDSPLNDSIDVFNRTVGKEKGIRVEVTMVSNTNNIHRDVLAAANGDPGAPALPDLFSSYPKTVLAMPDDGVLVDFRDYFTDDDLADFIPAFLEEGTVQGRLVVLPVAKSTEVLFVNRTIFRRFADETGAKLEDLRTWEGIFRTAVAYARWTDARTPDIPGDAKPFLAHDYPFNYFQVGCTSLGAPFFEEDSISFSDTFETVWKPYAEAAIEGGVWLQTGYATEPLRTGDAVISVASSASVLYYADEVTYADNTSEKAEIVAMPCPVFENGDTTVMQRGAGFCLVKSTPEREKAAVDFLQWLTEPAQNAEFVAQGGYMPVTREAFETYLPMERGRLTDPKYISLYHAYEDTYASYTFYSAPQMENYLALESAFEKNIRVCLLGSRKAWLESGSPAGTEAAVKSSLENFRGLFAK